MLVLHPKNAID